ncbi:MAG: hypothetical protein ACRCSK_08420 [Fusobacteriaceae bacterium]
MLNILVLYFFFMAKLFAIDKSCDTVTNYLVPADNKNFQLVKITITLTDTKNNYLYSMVAVARKTSTTNQFKIFKTIRSPIVPQLGCTP